jgi:L-glyceraldehyde reductase
VAFKSNRDILNLFPTTPGDDHVVAIDDDISITDTWKGSFLGDLMLVTALLISPGLAMTKLPKSKAKAVGVSNFTIEQVCCHFT